MKIGIIGAMEEEVSELKASLKDAKVTTIARMEFCEGTFGTTDVVVVQSGIGKVNAAACAQILINHFGVTHVMNTGVAGSLNAKIDIGDIVVSTDAMYHDVDATVFGYAKGEVPQIGTASFQADEMLRKAAVDAVKNAASDIHVFEGRVVSGDQFISSRDVKNNIRDTFHGDCTEMEGAAIAQVAYINDVPFVIIRAISDKADDSGQEAYDVFEKKAAMHCAHIVEYMITHLGE
ncbi:MAG: 5'-methylthioadenosine/adenosylhomocysteine nucleosidase [Lachnospiraceae bacterium]|jgi:adenosylhomocysteine nucleosidase|nr:5'-methylthioadenosine/adenosylhomocysteine nucleosidase [Lachnospiraceae bacterium]MEE3379917.1 5'-methylthioadenosine/adenosylhomocysteine nucleosidase [Lachnospiraceae bacterium]MEE3433749.1 5'-methylthioadenosine/adenosylhomocysteine nucleosidase [Lachnospiraceae bacterium]